MKENKISSLVSCSWLAEHINDVNIIVLDASLKNQAKKAPPNSENLQIPNSQFFDIKIDFSDPNGTFPNTFPSPSIFEKNARKLGVNAKSKIVVYDRNGIYSSARAWWLFKTFGHNNVAVLDGGFPEWISNGYATEELTKKSIKKGDFVALEHPQRVQFYENIKENVTTKSKLVIDVRSEERFNGSIPEPRPEVRSGQIPNSINIPFQSLLTKGKFVEDSQLQEIFKRVNKEKRPIIFSCGTGITACVALLGYEKVYSNPTAIYDGSWTEWGSRTR